jgi:putative hydrolase of the HAD superfamily
LAEYRGLVADYGGVLTTSLTEAFRSFCEREDVDYQHLRTVLRQAYGETSPESVVARFETGRMDRQEFEREMAAALSEGLERPIDAGGLIERMGADLHLDRSMVAAMRAVREAGIRTALLSNSWGDGLYPHDLLSGLFDAVLISGQVGIRKPELEAFRMAAERLGLVPAQCVFLDDFEANVAAAEKVGMRGVLHQEAARTIPQLERLLGVSLAEAATIESEDRT